MELNPDCRLQLYRFIETEADTILNTLRYYVVRAGLAEGTAVQEVALELRSEVVVEALAHADRFEPARQPLAWLLGIAANLIKRKQADRRKRTQREPLMRDMYATRQAAISDEELFDWLADLVVTDPAPDLEAHEAATEMLAFLSESDQQVVRLAILHGLDGETLATELSITPGAARVRLHRALNRLRQVWHEYAAE